MCHQSLVTTFSTSFHFKHSKAFARAALCSSHKPTRVWFFLECIFDELDHKFLPLCLLPLSWPSNLSPFGLSPRTLVLITGCNSSWWSYIASRSCPIGSLVNGKPHTFPMAPLLDPPDANLKRRATTLKADVKYNDTSHSTDWRNESPKENQYVLCRMCCAMLTRYFGVRRFRHANDKKLLCLRLWKGTCCCRHLIRASSYFFFLLSSFFFLLSPRIVS